MEGEGVDGAGFVVGGAGGAGVYRDRVDEAGVDGVRVDGGGVDGVGVDGGEVNEVGDEEFWMTLFYCITEPPSDRQFQLNSKGGREIKSNLLCDFFHKKTTVFCCDYSTISHGTNMPNIVSS